MDSTDTGGVYTQLQDPVGEPNDVEQGVEGVPNDGGDGGCESGA